MPPKIKDKFARQKISRSLASHRRKQDALQHTAKQTARSPEMFAAEELQPLIDWIAKNPTGAHSRIQEEFAKLSTQIPKTNELQRWLEPDEGARTQCRFGVGVILVKVYEAFEHLRNLQSKIERIPIRKRGAR